MTAAASTGFAAFALREVTTPMTTTSAEISTSPTKFAISRQTMNARVGNGDLDRRALSAHARTNARADGKMLWPKNAARL